MDVAEMVAKDGLEQVDGKVAFSTLREPAWHGLGTVLTEPLPTLEMLKSAHMADWNVRKVEVADKFPDFNFNSLPFLIVRDNPFGNGIDVLGFMGERYAPYQNEDLFLFADSILDGAGTWETAGSIRNGQTVFGALSIDENEVTLDPEGREDKLVTYLLCYSSHDGSNSIVFAITTVRVVCQNTLNLAIRGIKQQIKYRHTGTTSKRVEGARDVLGVTFKYQQAFEAEASALIQREITDKEFHKLISTVYPEPAEDTAKGGHKKWENKRDELVEIYFGPTCENIKGTAWGAVNALTEQLDWYRKPRKGNTENMYAAASGFDLPTTERKQTIFETAKGMWLPKPAKSKAKALVSVGG